MAAVNSALMAGSDNGASLSAGPVKHEIFRTCAPVDLQELQQRLRPGGHRGAAGAGGAPQGAGLPAAGPALRQVPAGVFRSQSQRTVLSGICYVVDRGRLTLLPGVLKAWQTGSRSDNLNLMLVEQQLNAAMANPSYTGN